MGLEPYIPELCMLISIPGISGPTYFIKKGKFSIWKVVKDVFPSNDQGDWWCLHEVVK